MRLPIFFLYHAFLNAAFVASDVYPWIEDDLIGGQIVVVRFVDEITLPMLDDFSFFEVVIFSGGNESPVTLYTTQRYNFSNIPQVDDPDNSPIAEQYYRMTVFVPWSVGSSIARGCFLGFRSHLKQNEDIEVINYTNRVTMINNGSLAPEVEEAAKAAGLKSATAPVDTYACKGQPCSREAAFSGISLTQRKTEEPKQELTEEQKFTIAISSTFGGIALILFVGVVWRCRQIRLKRKDGKRRWWDKLPPPVEGVSELQGRVGPYTTAELGGDGHRGSVFELQAGSVRNDQEGLCDGKGVTSMEASELGDTVKVQNLGDNKDGGMKGDVVSIPVEEINGREERDVDEILPDPKPSTFSSRYIKKRERKHSSAPIPESISRPPRDTSPHETTAMLGASSPQPSSVAVPKPFATRPASFPLLQGHEDYESIPRQSRSTADVDLEALAGVFAPPAPRPKPPPRPGAWIYR